LVELRIKVPNFFGDAGGIERINSVRLKVAEAAVAGSEALWIRQKRVG